MYVIEDKKGRFYCGSIMTLWTRAIDRATLYNKKKSALLNHRPEDGERVFEVKLVLGRQVK